MNLLKDLNNSRDKNTASFLNACNFQKRISSYSFQTFRFPSSDYIQSQRPYFGFGFANILSIPPIFQKVETSPENVFIKDCGLVRAEQHDEDRVRPNIGI